MCYMECRVCSSKDLELTINLGLHPWANNFLKREEVGKEPKYPLEIYHCGKCKAIQLGFTVKKEIMFGDHTYLSGMTKTLDNHFKNIADEVDKRFFSSKEGKSVLDIGSNDGTQLKHYKVLEYDVLGVESSKTAAEIANAAGVPTLHAFFNAATARGVGRKV